jgi:transporter family protein
MPAWIIFASLSAVFAALVAIFGKIGITNVDSTLATTIRAVVMAGFLIITSFAFKKFQNWDGVDSRALSFIFLSGIAGALSWIFYFYALKKGPASGVAALDRTSVVFVIVFSVLFLAEKLTWKLGLGAVLIAAGAILMIVP